MEGWGAREEEGKRGREGGSKRRQRLPTIVPFLITVTVTDTNMIAVTATITARREGGRKEGTEGGKGGGREAHCRPGERHAGRG